MSNLDVKIVKLEPFRAISAYGFGPEPEGIAFEKIKNFALSKGLIQEGAPPGTFGFNNPDPSPGSPNYGYEIWLPMEQEVEPEGDLRFVQFDGGLYATTTFTGLQNIGQVWGELNKWREDSAYRCGHHQWLEQPLNWGDMPIEEWIFTIYLPINE